MTNQTSPWPGRSGYWSRSTPLRRAGIVAVALALPCCGGAALIGSLSSAPSPVLTTAPAGAAAAPAADRVVGDRIAPGPAGTTAPPPAAAAMAPWSADTAARTPSRAARPSSARPVVTKRKITKREPIAYPARKVLDDALTQGDTRVRTKGVPGVRTTTYEIVLSGGRETSRQLVGSAVTKRPVTKVVLVGTRAELADDGCDPNYRPCVPIASDVDCAGDDGDGPADVDGPVRVVGDDPDDLDRDGDGIACDGRSRAVPH